MAVPRDEVTDLLVQWSRGDAGALDRLLPAGYEELRTLARSYLRRERRSQAVHTGTLVHQAFIRLVDARRIQWQGRAHFFGIAARLMRQILIDHARSRTAAKRGDGAAAEPLSSALPFATQAVGVDVLALDDALRRLAALDAQQARVVELRFFGGLTVEETAEVLGISPGTVKREWATARAWLRRALDGKASG